MSYARWSERSDVYVYPGDSFVCFLTNWLDDNDPDELRTWDAAEMLRFLKRLRGKGYEVPDSAFAGVFQDRNLYRDYDGDYEAMWAGEGRPEPEVWYSNG